MDVPDRDLFGRQVVNTSGARMGRIDIIVHQQNGSRIAVVRRGRVLRSWYRVSLDDAQLLDGRVLTSAPYDRTRPGEVALLGEVQGRHAR